MNEDKMISEIINFTILYFCGLCLILLYLNYKEIENEGL